MARRSSSPSASSHRQTMWPPSGAGGGSHLASTRSWSAPSVCMPWPSAWATPACCYRPITACGPRASTSATCGLLAPYRGRAGALRRGRLSRPGGLLRRARRPGLRQRRGRPGALAPGLAGTGASLLPGCTQLERLPRPRRQPATCPGHRGDLPPLSARARGRQGPGPAHDRSRPQRGLADHLAKGRLYLGWTIAPPASASRASP